MRTLAGIMARGPAVPSSWGTCQGSEESGLELEEVAMLSGMGGGGNVWVNGEGKGLGVQIHSASCLEQKTQHWRQSWPEKESRSTVPSLG